MFLQVFFSGFARFIARYKKMFLGAREKVLPISEEKSESLCTIVR